MASRAVSHLVVGAGVHTISFGGAGFAGGAFSQDITYRLRVTR